jgi:hypothetical protein
MSKSPRGRSFDEVVQERVGRDTDFAAALLQEAAQCMISGDIDVARSLVRDVIKGTVGYARLSRLTGTPEKSLIRMFGPKGSPTAVNLACVFQQLQRAAGVELEVRAVTSPRRRTGGRSTRAARSVAAAHRAA